jgi:hypothetical protein
MSLVNHCDLCHVELSEWFQVVGLMRQRTASEYHDRYPVGSHFETAEVCSAKCATEWLMKKWPAEQAVPA